MHLSIVLLLIISHLVCDFIFQGQYILNRRFSKSSKDNLIGNAIHSFIHFFVMAFILIMYCSLYKPLKFNYVYYFKILLWIAFMHFVIDEIKTFIIKFKPSFENSILLFITDQLIHISIIVLFTSNFNFIKISMALINITSAYPSSINICDRYLIIAIVFLSCTWGTGIFIRKYIQAMNFKIYRKLIDKEFIIIKNSKEVDIGSPNGGFIIGILERTFILLVMAIGQPQMVGFVLTAKSIARFKKMDDSSFAEYFIIGTFISFILAIVGGIIIKTLQVIPVIK